MSYPLPPGQMLPFEEFRSEILPSNKNIGVHILLEAVVNLQFLRTYDMPMKDTKKNVLVTQNANNINIL